MLVILKGTLCLFMAVLPCSAQLHSDRRLDATTICQDGTCFESTAHAMFDVIAKFATGDPSATYELTTTTTFEDLFTCTIGDPNDDLAESQHFAWQALSIVLKPTPTQSSSRTRMVTLLKLLTNGAIDARVHLDAPSRAHVTKNVPTRRLVNRKCLSTHLTTERLYTSISTSEPCNFASNLADYRVMPQLCGGMLPHGQRNCYRVQSCVRRPWCWIGNVAGLSHVPGESSR